MKKIFLFSLLSLAMGMGFTACDDYEEPNPPAQSNPQEAIFQADGVTVLANESTADVLDLKALNDQEQLITLSDVTIQDVPDGYTLKPVLKIAKNNTFDSEAEVPCSVNQIDATHYSITVTPDDLQGVYYDKISHGPKQKTIFYRYEMYLVNGSSEARVGGPDTFFGPYQLNIIPFPSSLVIENAYYLIGTVNGWQMPTALKLNHSDLDPYDDPVFSIKVDISREQAAEGWWWKIVPESTQATGNWVDAANASYGVADNGDTAMSGMLVPRTETEDCGAGCITEMGSYLLTINLEEGTYEFSLAIDNLWTPGSSNSWSPATSQMLFTSDYAIYHGFAHLNGEFKFTTGPDWNHINLGFESETADLTGTLTTDGGAGNISVKEDALYWCDVNLPSLTYALLKVKNISLIGSFNSWDDDLDLSPSTDFLTWSGRVTLSEGDEFKIRINHDWTHDFGGQPGALTYKGSNMSVPAGTYSVTLHLNTLPYTLELK